MQQLSAGVDQAATYILQLRINLLLKGCLAAQERLDPIDWAIYGSYLWANESALFQRVRILYGSLIHHKRTPAEV